MSLWEEVLKRIEQQLSRSSFETWIKSSQLMSIDEESGTAIVGTSNEFARDWLEARYSSLIQETLSQITGNDYTLQFLVEDGQAEEKQNFSSQLPPSHQQDAYELLVELTRQVSELTSEVSSLHAEIKELKEGLGNRLDVE